MPIELGLKNSVLKIQTGSGQFVSLSEMPFLQVIPRIMSMWNGHKLQHCRGFPTAASNQPPAKYPDARKLNAAGKLVFGLTRKHESTLG
ncbi:hypothetical protein [Noviherbaspirillum aerium]|uniref:hypothetical protein n=1 Tax=Noviherbaspirillum aerium TaxID=2588497 RepID=UPI00124DD728|nr:hypothetical protein [Noviherbaspirillum aerium]